jgi:hypothetical protein
MRITHDVDLNYIAAIIDGLADGFIPVDTDLRYGLQAAARILAEIGRDHPTTARCPNCGAEPGIATWNHWLPQYRGMDEFVGFGIVGSYSPG